ncbi:replication initiator protein A [Limosilactobacillus mucosae]|uniref:Replication initiator protein A n=1 Tax=Limosilactobacillus mucosae TaxID=97478 RepID=A0AAJ1HT15_LIMMU|nr:replication initiator protein A [Limosilactobacillus mucosae]MDC2828984.1 replication initiator protein A [Limosilactobacillus mucosae]
MLKLNFFKFDLRLIMNKNYRELDVNAVAVYSLYRTRLCCSIQLAQKGDYRYIDRSGQPFIYFPNEEMASILKLSKHTIVNVRKKLVKLGLIKIKQYGSRCYRVYVNDYIHDSESDFGSSKCEPHQTAKKAPNCSQSASDQRLSRGSSDESLDVHVVNASRITSYNKSSRKVDSIDSSAKIREEKIQNESIKESVKSENTYQPIVADEQKAKPSAESIEGRSLQNINDNDLDFTVKLYRSRFGHVTNYTYRYLASLMNQFGAQKLCFAIKLSVGRSISNPPAYIASILYNDRQNGIRTLDDMISDHLQVAKYLDASYSAMNQNRKKFRIMTQQMLSQFRNAPKIPILKLPEDDTPSTAPSHPTSESEYEFCEVPITPPKQNWQANNFVDANSSNSTCNFDQNDQFVDYPADWLTKRIVNEKKAVRANDSQQRIVEQAIGNHTQTVSDSAASPKNSRQSQDTERENYQPPFSLNDFKKQIFGFKQNGLNPGMA